MKKTNGYIKARVLYLVIFMLFFLFEKTHAKEKQTVPLLSGMSINTSNSVANVEVRGKSQGPGFCNITVNGGGNSISYAAPPQTWGPWVVLFSHIGAVSSVIESDIGCDTGALMELKYFAE